MSAHPSIKIGVSTGHVVNSNDIRLLCLYENKASLGYTSGMIKIQGSRHDMAAAICYQDLDPLDIEVTCAPTTAYNLKKLGFAHVAGQGLFNFGCLESFGCSAGDDCTNNTCATWGSRESFETGIPIRSSNTAVPPNPTGLTITPISGGLTIGWNSVNDPTGGEVFAYYVAVLDGTTLVIDGYIEAGLLNTTIGGLTNGKAYSVKVSAMSHNGIRSTGATGMGTPAGATNPQVYNILTIPDSLAAGISFTIKAQIANTGASGKVRAVFKVGGTQISDQNSTLNTYPGGGLWEPTIAYTMPNAAITITVDAYGWDGTNWVLTNTQSISRTPSAVPCTGVTLTPFTASINAGGKVTFTASVTPSTTAFDVQFKDRAGTILGTCKTSVGSCTFIWDSTGKTAGTYYVTASVAQGLCNSTEASILISPPISQWNVNIYVKDSVTNLPISGATVVTGTQSKTTDTTGLAAFRVDQGQIYITISQSGYNTFSTTELVFSDKTFNYVISPVAAATGSIQFVSVPVGAEIFLDGADQGVKTPITVSNIPSGAHTFTLKLAGYSDASGSVTVIGGSTVQVYMALSPVTPAAGSLYAASMPLSAEIFIDNIDQKITTPATITNLTPGSHTVKLTSPGYQDWTGTVTIVAGTTQYINPTLPPLTTTGSLEITTIPPGARVYLDNTDQQKVTPATITNLTAGSHPYKLVLSGYTDATGTVMIEAGKTAQLTITLNKIEAAPSNTALLLVAGSVAVVAIAVVVARRTEAPGRR